MGDRPRHTLTFDLSADDAAALLNDLETNEAFRDDVARDPIGTFARRGVYLPDGFGVEDVVFPPRPGEEDDGEYDGIDPDSHMFMPCCAAAVIAFLRTAARRPPEPS